MSQTSGFVRQGKWVGWRMSKATLKLLLISHACVWHSSPPCRVTSEERGWHWRGSFLFQHTVNSASVAIENPARSLSCCWHKIKTAAQTWLTYVSLNLGRRICGFLHQYINNSTQEKKLYFYKECAELFRISCCGYSERKMRSEQIGSACAHTSTQTMN